MYVINDVVGCNDIFSPNIHPGRKDVMKRVTQSQAIWKDHYSFDIAMFIQVSDPTADQSLSNLKDHLERACHLTYFTPRSYLSNGGRPKQEHYDQEARVQNLKTWVRAQQWN